MSLRKWSSTLISLVFLFSLSANSQIELRYKRNAATVLFASISGAVLGLSTLPFYGAPEEHTNNISLGALLGFGVGVGYLFYNSQQSTMLERQDYVDITDDSIRFAVKGRNNSASNVNLVRLQYTF